MKRSVTVPQVIFKVPVQGQAAGERRLGGGKQTQVVELVLEYLCLEKKKKEYLCLKPSH